MQFRKKREGICRCRSNAPALDIGRFFGVSRQFDRVLANLRWGETTLNRTVGKRWRLAIHVGTRYLRSVRATQTIGKPASRPQLPSYLRSDQITSYESGERSVLIGKKLKGGIVAGSIALNRLAGCSEDVTEQIVGRAWLAAP